MYVSISPSAIHFVLYSSLTGAFSGLILFRSPTSRWASATFGLDALFNFTKRWKHRKENLKQKYNVRFLQDTAKRLQITSSLHEERPSASVCFCIDK